MINTQEIRSYFERDNRIELGFTRAAQNTAIEDMLFLFAETGVVCSVIAAVLAVIL